MAFQTKATEEHGAPLSSAPCTPAPGRRIIIIRCDNQLSPANLFVSFDRVVPPAPPEPPAKPRKSSGGSSSSESSSSEHPPPPAKKKWSLLRAMFGVSSTSKSSDAQASNKSDDMGTHSPDTTLSTDKCLDGHPERSQQSSSEPPPQPKPAHQPFFFKFSLEWMDRPHWPGKNRRLFPPSLPAAAQVHLQQLRRSRVLRSESDALKDVPQSANDEKDTEFGGQVPCPTDEQPPAPPAKDPIGPYQVPKAAAYDKLVASKYVGRALAEWALVVSEYDSFFARRRDEGVPCDRLVETPMLGVENIKK